MKTKFLIILAVIFMMSCKKEKEDNNLPQEPQKKVETFNVKLDMVVHEDDNFQLFYTEFEDEGFDGKKSLWTSVKGNEEPQEIVFNLPKDVIPLNLRVDLGNNENQKVMNLNSFEMEYFGKTYSLKDSLILQNFIIGDQLIYDKENSTLTPNKGSKDLYDPMLYPRNNLKKEIEKIVQ
jgi:hypothetical protein